MQRAQQFFEALYRDCEQGWLTIWTLPDKKTYWFEVERYKDAAALADKLSKKKCDVYFGVGLRKERIKKGRGEAKDVIAIPGVWFDMDVASDAHKEKRLPQTVEEAAEWIEGFAVRPSILVHSGHGLHAYWAFKEPWYFGTEEEREQGATFLSRFQATLKGHASVKGWRLDTTHDLARVLRVPGTMNFKQEPVPVTVVKVNQYDVAAI